MLYLEIYIHLPGKRLTELFILLSANIVDDNNNRFCISYKYLQTNMETGTVT